MSDPPLFSEATGGSPYTMPHYGRNPSIVQPMVFYYQAPLARVEPQRLTGPSLYPLSSKTRHL